jgi:hypothetical protein
VFGHCGSSLGGTANLPPPTVDRPVRIDVVADTKERKARYVDNGWPTTDPDNHAVSELATDRTGALSPFGEVVFPVPAEELPYVHPVTVATW